MGIILMFDKREREREREQSFKQQIIPPMYLIIFKVLVKFSFQEIVALKYAFQPIGFP